MEIFSTFFPLYFEKVYLHVFVYNGILRLHLYCVRRLQTFEVFTIQYFIL